MSELPDLRLAEHLELDPAGIYRLNQPQPPETIISPLGVAWAGLEILLRSPTGDTAGSIADITGQFQTIAESDDSERYERYRAGLVVQCMPFFGERALRSHAAPEKIPSVYSSLGQFLLELPWNDSDGIARAIGYDGMAIALALRNGSILHPASQRERRSSKAFRTVYDVYEIDNDSKIPVRVSPLTRDKGHSYNRPRPLHPAIKRIALRTMVCQAAKKAPGILPGQNLPALIPNPQKPAPGVADQLLEAARNSIAKEGRDEPLTAGERNFLNDLSHRITRHLNLYSPVGEPGAM
jgi:hypothetical protein